MSVTAIENILSRATQDVRKLLEAAFEAGRMDMKRELETFLSRSDTALFTGTVGPAPDIESRAPSGTVKPGIKALIENASNGITASEIVEKTGFKENSVRGTLSALKADGFAERRGELWFMSQEKSPPALASEPSSKVRG
jgi:hypothetical protein